MSSSSFHSDLTSGDKEADQKEAAGQGVYWDKRFVYETNPLHKIVAPEMGNRGVLPVVRLKLFPISGFQGSGSADISLTTALQFLYPDYQFQLLKGMSFEILSSAVEQQSQLGLTLQMDQKGSITQWPLIANKLRVGGETIVCSYGGPPCDKVSYGVLNCHELTFIGPHQSPSNLVFEWAEGLHRLAVNNGNDCIASLSEMVEPASPKWLPDYAQLGEVHHTACHKVKWGAERNRLYMISPHAKIKWVVDKEEPLLWDGAKWPAAYCLERYPPVLRSILPVLMVKRLKGETKDWENRQLDRMKVRYEGAPPGSQVRYASPLHWAQWLGWPKELAVEVIGQPCKKVIDDLMGLEKTHFASWVEAHRPPPTRFAQCGVRRFCETCEEKLKRLGQGWHIPSASLMLAHVIQKTADHRLRVAKHSFHPFDSLKVHKCSSNCPLRITVKRFREEQREENKAKRVKVSSPSQDLIQI